jgi:hypothetical protein
LAVLLTPAFVQHPGSAGILPTCTACTVDLGNGTSRHLACTPSESLRSEMTFSHTRTAGAARSRLLLGNLLHVSLRDHDFHAAVLLTAFRSVVVCDRTVHPVPDCLHPPSGDSLARQKVHDGIGALL